MALVPWREEERRDGVKRVEVRSTKGMCYTNGKAIGSIYATSTHK
jgi:hypothetical protein